MVASTLYNYVSCVEMNDDDNIKLMKEGGSCIYQPVIQLLMYKWTNLLLVFHRHLSSDNNHILLYT